MKIIISPAKKMNVDTDTFEWMAMPRFLEKTEQLMHYIRSCSLEQCRQIWKCSDKIAVLNYDRFQHMDLRRSLTPAIVSYEGLQYQYMAPTVLEQEALDYLQGHLCILSGFYGVLRPFDGVVPYRLEMQSGLGGEEIDSLYEFWGDILFRSVTEEGEGLILNLASREYSRSIERYLKAPGGQGITYITCIFGEEKEGRVKEKGTYAKMARGEMVRFLAENRIEDIEKAKSFNRLGFRFSASHSDEARLVFLR
ncbi:MAG: peroxide stress protein YaaA [Kineothrix sp.]